MTRGSTAKIHERSGRVRKKKREDMRTPLTLDVQSKGEKQRSGKRSYGKQVKQGRKKFPSKSRKNACPGSSRKVVGKKKQRRQCRLQLEMMELETQLAKMKDEIREWGESLLAVNAVEQAEAKRQLLVETRNALKDNLLEMKATEAFLMHQLGFL